jgi:glycosyltransferase involved in cell wall biosynthesis
VLAVVTPVKNEPKKLLDIAEQIISQTLQPKLWVIVDDGSTDRTPDVMDELAGKYKFVLGVREGEHEGYDEVFRYGHVVWVGLEYASHSCKKLTLLGVLDVDMRLEKSYYEKIANSFKTIPRLGVASGLYFESDNGASTHLTQEKGACSLKSSICSAAMMFKKECLSAIGGFPTCPRPDTVALLKAANRGWRIGILSSTYAIHLEANRSLSKYLKIGCASYMLGYHPLNALASGPFEALKTFSISPLGLTAGYILGALRTNKIADGEIRRYFHESFLRRSYEAIAMLSLRKNVNLDPIENALNWF